MALDIIRSPLDNEVSGSHVKDVNKPSDAHHVNVWRLHTTPVRRRAAPPPNVITGPTLTLILLAKDQTLDQSSYICLKAPTNNVADAFLCLLGRVGRATGPHIHVLRPGSGGDVGVTWRHTLQVHLDTD